jgi:hypothetical protein
MVLSIIFLEDKHNSLLLIQRQCVFDGRLLLFIKQHYKEKKLVERANLGHGSL